MFESRPYREDDFSDATAISRRLCDEGGLAVCRADVRGTGCRSTWHLTIGLTVFDEEEQIAETARDLR